MKQPILIIAGLFLLISQTFAQDLSLEETINLALANNPQVIAAAQKIEAARARQGQATGEFLPKITLDASRGQTYAESPSIILPAVLGGGTFSAMPSEVADYTSYGITLKQTVFAGGRWIANRIVADISLQAAREAARQAASEVTFKVISAFYDVKKAEKNLAVIEEAAVNLQRNLEYTQAFYNAQTVSLVDLMRAKTQLANLEINRIQAHAALQIARLALASTMGQKKDLSFTLAEPPLSPAATIKLDQAQLSKLAFENRPDWLSYKLGMEAAEKALTVTYGSFMPTLTYTYSNGRARTEYVTHSTSNSDLGNWRSLLSFSWPIFEGFQTSNKILEARATYNTALAQQTEISDAIALEVDSSYLNLKSAQEKIIASDTAADLAEKTLKIADVNYKATVITEQSFLDAQVAAQTAKQNLWFARYDYEVAKARLNKAIGKTVI